MLAVYEKENNRTIKTQKIFLGDGDASAAPRHPTLLNTNIYPAVTPGPHLPNASDPDSGFKFR